MSYVDTLLPQQITIVLAGREVIVPRARLGQYLLLERVLDDFEAAPGWAEISQAIRRYFEIVGLNLAGAHPVEILTAFAALGKANGWQWTPAFMREPSPPRKEKIAYDYEGRNWAWVIHKLASRYGWSDDHILNLYPERAACYLQEILVSEQLEAEERHSLSELAYQYDRVSKTSRYVPLPRPGWMVDSSLPEPVRIPRSALPYGVQNLKGEIITYH